MYDYRLLFLLISLFRLAECEECKSPANLANYEDNCLDEVSGFIEKVERYATTAFASAKRFFGVASDQKEEPKKCEYYTCLLNRLHLLNPSNLTERPKFQEWMVKNVEDSGRANLNRSINECFNGFLANVDAGKPFEGAPMASYEPLRIETNESAYNQNPCDINKNMIKCLAKGTNNCPFKYP